MAAGSSSSDHLSSSTGEKLVFDLSGDEKSKYMKLTGAGVESIPESKQSCLMEGRSSPVEKGKASMSGVGDSDKIPDESVVLQKSNIEPEISYVSNCFSNVEKEKGKAIASGSGNLGQIIGRGKMVGNIEDIRNLIPKIKEELSSGSSDLGQIIGRGKNVGNIEDIRNLIAKIKEELSNMLVTHDYQSRKRDHRTRMLDSVEYVRNLFNNFEKKKGKVIAGGSGNLGQIIGLGKNVGNIEDIRNRTAKIKEYNKVKLSRIRELYNKLQEEKLMSIPSRAGDSDKITSAEVVTEMSGIENVTADNKLQEEKFISITSGSCDSHKITNVEVVAEMSAIENVTADNKLQEEKFVSIPSGSCDSDKITIVEVVTQMSGIENVTTEMHAEISPQSLEMSELLDFNELLSDTGPHKRQRGAVNDCYRFSFQY